GVRDRVLEHSKVRGQRVRSGIIETERVTTMPVAGLAERLAWRPADQEGGFTSLKPPSLEDLGARDGHDVALDDRPSSVRANGLAALAVHLDRHRGVEARRLETVVEAAGAAVEGDHLRLGHLAVRAYEEGLTSAQSCFLARILAGFDDRVRCHEWN